MFILQLFSQGRYFREREERKKARGGGAKTLSPQLRDTHFSTSSGKKKAELGGGKGVILAEAAQPGKLHAAGLRVLRGGEMVWERRRGRSECREREREAAAQRLLPGLADHRALFCSSSCEALCKPFFFLPGEGAGGCARAPLPPSPLKRLRYNNNNPEPFHDAWICSFRFSGGERACSPPSFTGRGAVKCCARPCIGVGACLWRAGGGGGLLPAGAAWLRPPVASGAGWSGRVPAAGHACWGRGELWVLTWLLQEPTGCWSVLLQRRPRVGGRWMSTKALLPLAALMCVCVCVAFRGFFFFLAKKFLLLVGFPSSPPPSHPRGPFVPPVHTAPLLLNCPLLVATRNFLCDEICGPGWGGEKHLSLSCRVKPLEKKSEVLRGRRKGVGEGAGLHAQWSREKAMMQRNRSILRRDRSRSGWLTALDFSM